jgi:hypothetical protein
MSVLLIRDFMVRRLLVAGVVAVVMAGVAAGSAVAAPVALCAPAIGFCSGEGEYQSTFGVAVDNSGGEKNGDVYVASIGGGGGSSVGRFTAAGAPDGFSGFNLNITGANGNFLRIPEGAGTIGAVGVAVDAAGDFYVSSRESEPEVIDKFDPSGEPVASFPLPAEVTAVTGIAVDDSAGPSKGDIYVADETTKQVFKLDSTGAVVGGKALITGLSDPYAVAVSPDGAHVYVANFNGNAEQFSETGAPEGVLDANSTQSVGVDPSTGDVYVVEAGGTQIQAFNAKGEAQGEPFASGTLNGLSAGLAVNATSHFIYVSDLAANKTDFYGEGLTPPVPTTGAATEVTATTAVLHGTLAAEGEGAATEYQFDYNTDGSCAGGGSTTSAKVTEAAVSTEATGLEPDQHYTFCLVATNMFGSSEGSAQSLTTSALPPAIDSESSPTVHSSGATLQAQINPNNQATKYSFRYATSEAMTGALTLEGASALEGFGDQTGEVTIEAGALKASTTYYYRVVAENQKSEVEGKPAEGEIKQFTTRPLAQIDSESVAEVTSTSATLQGQINPFGTDTHYQFQYGTVSCTASPEACTSVPAPPGADIGSAETDQPASVHIQNLQPNTTYHYRLVALGAASGPDHTFTTQPNGSSFALPDNRGWEMVSPPNKSDSLITGIDGVPGDTAGGIIQADEAGNSIVYASNGSFEKAVSAPLSGQYLSTRSASGWSTANINPPIVAESYFVQGSGGPYKAFSSDLSEGLLVNGEYLPVRNPPLTPDAPAGYQNYYLHDNRAGTNAGFQTVLTEALITNAPSVEPSSAFTFRFQGATPDLGHVVFSTPAALTPDATPGSAGNRNLYEWSNNGQLRLVNILPGQAQSTPGAILGRSVAGNPGRTHPISNDGSVVLFTDAPDVNSRPNLYARKNAGQAQSALGPSGECTESGKACTVQIDASPEGLETGEGEFWAASSDGSRMFFTDSRKLTSDSTGNQAGPESDLYEYDLASGHLRDLTTADPAGAAVQGVLGASEDGSYVYFVANGELAQHAARGADNLYVSHDGTTKFIAALSQGDNSGLPKEKPPNADVADDWDPETANRTARVTPDGLGLVFMSDVSLTGYDNGGQQEVYVYDASLGRLSCASCRPTGARPTGPSSIPGGTDYANGLAIYQSRVISDVTPAGGVRGALVFFNSRDAIVPQDTNGARDVYEWEEDGVGSCRQAGGCVNLISSGTNGSESSFADASADGSDVFFLTYAQLGPQDTDGLVDVYDAREGGGFPGPGSSLACTGTGCQGVPGAPPTYAIPPSGTFSGGDNFLVATPAPPKPLTAAQKLANALKACARKPKRHRASCRARARKRYEAGRKARANAHRRGK